MAEKVEQPKRTPTSDSKDLAKNDPQPREPNAERTISDAGPTDDTGAERPNHTPGS